jgi:hypothetical protein
MSSSSSSSTGAAAPRRKKLKNLHGASEKAPPTHEAGGTFRNEVRNAKPGGEPKRSWHDIKFVYLSKKNT